MSSGELLEFTSKGIYCKEADIFIDPWKPVDRAIITHAHADHARPGMKHYLAHQRSKSVMQHRLGQDIRVETFEYGQKIRIRGVLFEFFPAGHVVGSTQIRVSHGNQSWCVSGDYKVEDDGISGAFEPVPCHTFITECTFGLPVFNWKPQKEVFQEIQQWWQENQKNKKVSVLIAYSLGKAQRVLANLKPLGQIYLHDAVANINDALEKDGVVLPKGLKRLGKEKARSLEEGALVVAPNAFLQSNWVQKSKNVTSASCSGWMQVRGTRRWQNQEQGFVLSDHADWDGLNHAISETGAERVIATHGYTEVFSRWLKEQGYEASTEKTWFESNEN
jgi:putative mRNA 3-end processing factor